MTPSIKESLLARLESLSPERQRQVLDSAESLGSRGVGGKSLLRFRGLIPDDDLKMMSASIEEACEKVDKDEWQIPFGHRRYHRSLFR